MWLIVSGEKRCRRYGWRGGNARAYGLQPRGDSLLQQEGQSHTTDGSCPRGPSHLRSHGFIRFMGMRANLRVAGQRRPSYRGFFSRRWRYRCRLRSILRG
jgi:hypothetical protein